jgi:hypothetical protein
MSGMQPKFGPEMCNGETGEMLLQPVSQLDVGLMARSAKSEQGDEDWAPRLLRRVQPASQGIGDGF